jgi:hypothetical protein
VQPILGDQGVDSVTGVIYPPQVALVGFGRVIIGVHQHLQVEIPEADYGKLATLNGMVAYLADKLGNPPQSLSGAG